jgi:hypothetical protein
MVRINIQTTFNLLATGFGHVWRSRLADITIKLLPVTLFE